MEGHKTCYLDTIDYLEKQLKELKDQNRVSLVKTTKVTDEDPATFSDDDQVETERELNPGHAQRQETSEGMVGNPRRVPVQQRSKEMS